MISLRAQSLFLIAAAVAAVSSFPVVAAARPRVHPDVHRALRAQGSVNLIVTLSDSTESVLESVKESEFATRGDKIASLVDRLEAHTSKSQASLNDLLDGATSTRKLQDASAPLFKSKTSFWISNQVHFEDASFELVEKLAGLEGVAEIREELMLSIPTPIVSTTSNASNMEAVGLLADTEWGITKISAADVWAQGYTGQGVVVGIIDSGVLSTHPSLKNSFRSSYGWYDPINRTRVPSDEVGHGTHVTGTIVGSDGIGVAPGATWIACKGCLTKCSESALITCGQFMTCPTTATGTNKDCSKAPRIVSNSWGGPQGDSFYNAIISAWRAAGIVPVFAIGNEQPGCKTAGSPGDSKSVITVGSTSIIDGLSSFSNKGPGTGGVLKPDVSAPGENIRSAWINGGYNMISGTSMATPHVSGIVALLLSARSSLTYDDVKSALTATAQRGTLKPSGYTCGGTSDAVIPNNQYGYGRVNALTAFNSVMYATPAPTPELPISDRCAGLSEVFCGELLCEWNADSKICSSSF